VFAKYNTSLIVYFTYDLRIGSNSANDPIRSYVQAQAAGKDVSPTRIEGIADICRYAIIGFFLRFLWEGMSADIDSSIDTLSVLFNDIVENTLIKK
jgi:hypothetical protein